MYDIVIIGAGVAGCFMARELARYNVRILLLDKENDVGNATSMANSAIIHSGYDAKAGYKKAEFNAIGNKMFDKICEELDVEFDRCGSIVVGFDDEDEKTIASLYENGLKNDVPSMKILSGDEVRELEPNISQKVTVGLLAESAGIISPFSLCVALAEVAIENGAEMQLETEVVGIEKDGENYIVKTNKQDFKTRYIINAAGVYTDKIHDMVGEPYFKIRARKGNYYLFDKNAGNLVSRVIFQCPSSAGKGVLITPTVHGNVLVGPNSEYVDDKDDVSTTSQELEYVRRVSSKTIENIPFNQNIRVFAGLRANSDKNDFIIEESPSSKGFINIAGFESPGLSSIPAVADNVVELFKNIVTRDGSIKLSLKPDYNPRRRRVVRFSELSVNEKIEKIKENSDYGRVICRCEMATEAEIIDAIHRKAGARSLKAIKKRARPGSGRCQGGFCAPRVQEILARELGKKIEEIPYDSSKSFVLTGKTKE